MCYQASVSNLHLAFFCDTNEILATRKPIFSDKNRFLYLVHKVAGGV